MVNHPAVISRAGDLNAVDGGMLISMVMGDRIDDHIIIGKNGACHSFMRDNRFGSNSDICRESSKNIIIER